MKLIALLALAALTGCANDPPPPEAEPEMILACYDNGRPTVFIEVTDIKLEAFAAPDGSMREQWIARVGPGAWVSRRPEGTETCGPLVPPRPPNVD